MRHRHLVCWRCQYRTTAIHNANGKWDPSRDFVLGELWGHMATAHPEIDLETNASKDDFKYTRWLLTCPDDPSRN